MINKRYLKHGGGVLLPTTSGKEARHWSDLSPWTLCGRGSEA